MDRPTLVTVKQTGSDQALWVKYDSYDSKKTDTYAIFSKKYVDDYLAYIAKFQDWSAKATAAGDAFDKDIDKASSQMGFKLKFGFASGNAAHHYLVVTPCVLLMCGDSGLSFNDDNAAELVKLLQQLKDGKLVAEDVGQKYN